MGSKINHITLRNITKKKEKELKNTFIVTTKTLKRNKTKCSKQQPSRPQREKGGVSTLADRRTRVTAIFIFREKDTSAIK